MSRTVKTIPVIAILMLAAFSIYIVPAYAPNASPGTVEIDKTVFMSNEYGITHDVTFTIGNPVTNDFSIDQLLFSFTDDWSITDLVDAGLDDGEVTATGLSGFDQTNVGLSGTPGSTAWSVTITGITLAPGSEADVIFNDLIAPDLTDSAYDANDEEDEPPRSDNVVVRSSDTDTDAFATIATLTFFTTRARNVVVLVEDPATDLWRPLQDCDIGENGCEGSSDGFLEFTAGDAALNVAAIVYIDDGDATLEDDAVDDYMPGGADGLNVVFSFGSDNDDYEGSFAGVEERTLPLDWRTAQNIDVDMDGDGVADFTIADAVIVRTTFTPDNEVDDGPQAVIEVSVGVGDAEDIRDWTGDETTAVITFQYDTVNGDIDVLLNGDDGIVTVATDPSDLDVDVDGDADGDVDDPERVRADVAGADITATLVDRFGNTFPYPDDAYEVTANDAVTFRIVTVSGTAGNFDPGNLAEVTTATFAAGVADLTGFTYDINERYGSTVRIEAEADYDFDQDDTDEEVDGRSNRVITTVLATVTGMTATVDDTTPEAGSTTEITVELTGADQENIPIVAEIDDDEYEGTLDRTTARTDDDGEAVFVLTVDTDLDDDTTITFSITAPTSIDPEGIYFEVTSANIVTVAGDPIMFTIDVSDDLVATTEASTIEVDVALTDAYGNDAIWTQDIAITLTLEEVVGTPGTLSPTSFILTEGDSTNDDVLVPIAYTVSPTIGDEVRIRARGGGFTGLSDPIRTVSADPFIEFSAPEEDAQFILPAGETTVSVTFEGTAEIPIEGPELVIVEYSLDGAAWVEIEGAEGATLFGFDLTFDLELGSHTLRVRAEDDEGRTGEGSITITVATEAPPVVGTAIFGTANRAQAVDPSTLAAITPAAGQGFLILGEWTNNDAVSHTVWIYSVVKDATGRQIFIGLSQATAAPGATAVGASGPAGGLASGAYTIEVYIWDSATLEPVGSVATFILTIG